MHDHTMGGLATPWVTPAVIGTGLTCFLALYLLAVAASRRRGRPWQGWRMACAAAGVLLGIVAVGPLGVTGHHDFVVHMWGHLLLGMAAPLLLVLSSPVRLALRALPTRRARQLSALLSTPYFRAVTHPVVAAILDVGGLWLLYTTPLYAVMHHSWLVHLIVHVHVLSAGWVFTAAILQVDPAPHPTGHPLRAVVLVLFLALHSILAKRLYPHPPAGVSEASAQTGAQVMYYGGDYVDLALVILFCLDWYRRSAPRGRSLAAAGPLATRRGEAGHPA